MAWQLGLGSSYHVPFSNLPEEAEKQDGVTGAQLSYPEAATESIEVNFNIFRNNHTAQKSTKAIRAIHVHSSIIPINLMQPT
jgi:hypothetical protein